MNICWWYPIVVLRQGYKIKPYNIELVNLMRFVCTFIGKLWEDVGCCKGCIQSNIHIKPLYPLLCATNRIAAILDKFYSIFISQDLGYCSQGFAWGKPHYPSKPCSVSTILILYLEMVFFSFTKMHHMYLR